MKKKSKFVILGTLLMILGILSGIFSFILPFIGFASQDVGGFALSGAGMIVLFIISTPLFIVGVILLIVGLASDNKGSFDSITKGFGKKYCDYCGAELDPRSNFCTACGAAKKARQ